MQKKKGISLITLVITIVVIVILVGVIALSISNNNPINQATEAVLRNDLVSMKEQFTVEYANLLGQHLGDASQIKVSDFSGSLIPEKYSNNFEITTSGIKAKAENTLTDREKEIVKEILGDVVPVVIDGVTIPAGFYYVGGTKENGIVISDSKVDENIGADENGNVTSNLEGNQFVWVPVADMSLFIRSNWRTWKQTGEPDLMINNVETKTGCWELIGNPDIANPVREVDAIYKSVKENKGFYVARYTAGAPDKKGVLISELENASTAKQDGTDKVVSKKGYSPWIFVRWGAGTGAYDGGAGDDKAEGANAICRGMYSNSSSVVSHLIYGVQWDAIMRWMKDIDNPNTDGKKYVTDSKYMGNFSDSPGSNGMILTGTNDNYRVKNIYDLAGNIMKWTFEPCNADKRTSRGGQAYQTSIYASVASRDYTGAPDLINGYRSMLTAMYIK